MARKIMISIAIRPDQKDKLDKEHNMSRIIREAIDLYYKERGDGSGRKVEMD